jgi:membrane protein DedA with SNARE-associated domain
MTAFYLGFLTWIHSSRYVLLFIGAIIEGPVLMVTAGFLLKLNQFNLVPMYFALIAGDFTADMGWYAVGYFGARPLIDKVGRFLNITPEIIAKIEARFKMYQDKILFISKITMGFGFALATLIVAGMLHVDVKKYALLNFLGGFIWTGLLVAVGYFFGNVFAALAGPFKIVFAALAVVFVVVGLHYINRYLVNTEI